MDTFRLILSIVVLLGAAYILVNLVLRKKAMALVEEIGRENVLMISSNANFFGQESQGVFQIRGNGVLILTRDKLLFQLLAPKKIIEIPLERIAGIEEPIMHLGKSRGGRLIKIIYKNESESMDSCAWQVRNRKEWIDTIEQLLGA